MPQRTGRSSLRLGVCGHLLKTASHSPSPAAGRLLPIKDPVHSYMLTNHKAKATARHLFVFRHKKSHFSAIPKRVGRGQSRLFAPFQ